MCFLTKLTEFVKVNHPCINTFSPTTFYFPTPSVPPTTWPIEKTDNGFTYLFTGLRHVGSGKRDWPSCSNIRLVSQSLINCQKTIKWSFRSRASHLPPLFCPSWHSKLEKKVSKAVSLVICTRGHSATYLGKLKRPHTYDKTVWSSGFLFFQPTVYTQSTSPFWL